MTCRKSMFIKQKDEKFFFITKSQTTINISSSTKKKKYKKKSLVGFIREDYSYYELEHS